MNAFVLHLFMLVLRNHPRSGFCFPRVPERSTSALCELSLSLPVLGFSFARRHLVLHISFGSRDKPA